MTTVDEAPGQQEDTAAPAGPTERERFAYWNSHPSNRGRSTTRSVLPLSGNDLERALSDPVHWPLTWATFQEDEQQRPHLTRDDGTTEQERFRHWNSHPANRRRSVANFVLPITERDQDYILTWWADYAGVLNALHADDRDRPWLTRPGVGAPPPPPPPPDEWEQRFRYWMAHPQNEGRTPGRRAMPYGEEAIEEVVAQHRAGRPVGTGNWAKTLQAFADDDVTRPWLTHEDVEPPLPKYDPDEAITVDDPRVRHLWVEAAKTADANDWCPTYDTVAEQSGVPTRQALRASGELKPHTTITFTLQVNIDRDGHLSSNDARRLLENEAERESILEALIGQVRARPLQEVASVYNTRQR